MKTIISRCCRAPGRGASGRARPTAIRAATAPAAARATARARRATRTPGAAAATHAAGEGTEHTNAYGGSTAHAYGGGTEHTNMYGGSTYGKYGEGAYHTYPSGATAYHPPGYPAYPTYPAYHRRSPCRITRRAATVAQPRRAQSSAWRQARPWLRPTPLLRRRARTPLVLPPAARTRRQRRAPPTAPAWRPERPRRPHRSVVVPASGTWVMGMSYAALPAGSITINKNGTTYYLSGNTWFQPAYGANGVFYKVVSAP